MVAKKPEGRVYLSIGIKKLQINSKLYIDIQNVIVCTDVFNILCLCRIIQEPSDVRIKQATTHHLKQEVEVDKLLLFQEMQLKDCRIYPRFRRHTFCGEKNWF